VRQPRELDRRTTLRVIGLKLGRQAQCRLLGCVRESDSARKKPHGLVLKSIRPDSISRARRALREELANWQELADWHLSGFEGDRQRWCGIGRSQGDARHRAIRGTPLEPELKKWSGRLDSNQRPPAPKIALSRFPATLRETSIALKPLIQKHLSQIIALHRGHNIARRNPAGTPNRGSFSAVAGP
jgi:hypothetical protein